MKSIRLALRVLGPHFQRYRTGLLLGLGALLAKVLLAACVPLLIREGINALTAGFHMRRLIEFCAYLVALSAIKGLFQYWMRVVIIGISRDIEYDLRNDLFSNLVTLSQDFYGRTRTGDIMARASNDLNAVRMMLGPGVMYWSETVLTFLISLVVMLAVDLKLTLLGLAPAPVISLAVVFFGRIIHERYCKIQQKFSDISSQVQENLSAVRVIRAFVQEEAELRQFEEMNRDYVRQNIRLARIQGLFMPLLQAMIGVTFLIVLWVGGMRLLEGRITLGDFVMFNTFMGMLIWPMIALGWVVNLMQRGSASLARVAELLDARPSLPEPDSPLVLRHGALRGEIELHHVTLNREAGAALQDVNLRIEGGETVAIVGHVGCGKTTLVQLVARLIDPTDGAVRLDGVDLRFYSPREIRRHVGFVPQETFLFSTTLRDNIAWGVPDATDDRIQWAARVAGLEPDIAQFPDGLDTLVGERGITLSGGQKQRAAIARAILRDPRILILDDALSSVDTDTEERILTELTLVMKGRTTILISHRVSTVRAAHRIVVLEKGRIVEQGAHANLLLRGGYYADLYQKQLLAEELETL